MLDLQIVVYTVNQERISAPRKFSGKFTCFFVKNNYFGVNHVFIFKCLETFLNYYY